MRWIAAAAIAAVAALVILLALRTGGGVQRGDAPDPMAASGDAPAALPPPGVISGTVTGRYGPMSAVAVVVWADAEVRAEASSDDSGRYRIEVPSGVRLEIEAVPLPETELLPMRETLTLSAGEERTLDFRLSTAGSAGVVILGTSSPLALVAIRSEDYPPGDPPAIADLEAAPKLSAGAANFFGGLKRDVSWSIRGLDPDATYRLAVLDRAWAVVAPADFRAGDTVTARVEPALRIFVAAEDIETREPLAEFRVSLTDESGTVVHAFEGVDGRLSRSLRMSGNALALVISADGYADERCPAEGVHRVALMRTRPPNVTLKLAYEDGTACAGEIEAHYESLDDPDGLREVSVHEDAPGRLRTTLPAGRWRLHVKRPRAFHDVTQVADVEVPAGGTAEASLRYRRGGTVTFERDTRLTRRVEGEWEWVFADEGAWEDVPAGTYRVMNGEEVVSTFDVLPGSTQFVQVPARRYR